MFPRSGLGLAIGPAYVAFLGFPQAQQLNVSSNSSHCTIVITGESVLVSSVSAVNCGALKEIYFPFLTLFTSLLLSAGTRY
uniref:Triple gene block3 n=1 Tax=Rumex interveinal chlorotic virus TaxID=1715695 RepID=A0A1J1LUC8_9VIRU|nr:triple gene block3 [Rumex interveinal chlorotic virus]